MGTFSGYIEDIRRCAPCGEDILFTLEFYTMFKVKNFTGDCHFQNSHHVEEVSVFILSTTKAYSLSLLVLFCAVNIAATVLSLFGNAVVFLTVACFSELQITSNIGLASFALANFFEGFFIHGLSVFVSVVTLQGGCSLSGITRFLALYLANVSVYSSLLNLALVTLERYIGVMYSLRYHLILHQERFAKLIAAVWITSFLLGILNLVDTTAEISGNTMTVVFSLSLTVAFCCSVKIYRVSRRQRQQVAAQASAIRQITEENQQLRFRGATTMFYIFVTLFICFVPALMIRILLKASVEAKHFTSLTLARPWAAVFFGMYTCISPYVYFFRSQELRKYSQKLLRRALGH